MGTRADIHIAGNLTNFIKRAVIRALALVEDAVTYDQAFCLIKRFTVIQFLLISQFC